MPVDRCEARRRGRREGGKRERERGRERGGAGETKIN